MVDCESENREKTALFKNDPSALTLVLSGNFFFFLFLYILAFCLFE